jgi:hypothetical protein
MSVVAVDNLIATARGVADQCGLSARVLAAEMILSATQAIAGSEVTIDRDSLVEGFRTVLPDIADADLREVPDRVTAAFLARTLFAQAAEMKLDVIEVAKEVVAVGYAKLVDKGDKVLARQIAAITFPAFCAKARRLYEVGAPR